MLMITSDSKYEWKNFKHDITIMISKEREREIYLYVFLYVLEAKG